jgi:hypothetical protein
MHFRDLAGRRGAASKIDYGFGGVDYVAQIRDNASPDLRMPAC